MRLLRTYKKTINLEAITSIVLILATTLAIFIYNSPYKSTYDYFLKDIYITKNFNLHMIINDFFMAIFFLVAGLEIKHEIINGNLSSLKKASFPILASLGGILVPALIFIFININTQFLNGFCIPISTDIAFAVGVFLIFAKKLHPSLKIFLLSLAIVDDFISIVAIGIFYSIDINFVYIVISLIILIILILANKVFNINNPSYYLIGGFCLWYFIYLSGIHCTVSGILLAITIPADKSNKANTLNRLQKFLVPFNSLFIIPIFAFANTGISIFCDIDFSTTKPLMYGIVLGLCIGKPLGIMLFSFIGCKLKIIEKPKDISWMAIFLVSILAGIGFTMSIFVCEIAFVNDNNLIEVSKLSILISSLISVLLSVFSINIYDCFIKSKSKSKLNIVRKHYIS